MGSATDPIASVEQAAELAALQAMAAYCGGTFSVGGLLVGADGTVVEQMHNRVIVDGALMDPTAHGERQLVDWYYAQVAAGVPVPAPENITVVTSLDPCCMCTGAILTAGFRAVTVAEDTESGINFDGSDSFQTLPAGLRPAALQTFSYPAIVGTTPCFIREARGANIIFPAGDANVDEKTAALCEVIFDDTLQTVRSDINSDVPPDQLLNILTLPEDNYIRVALMQAYPQALTLVFPRYLPDARLVDSLFVAMTLDRLGGGPGDATALIDYFGNLLLIAFGDQRLSGIETAFMACTRAYAALRHNLFQLHAQNPVEYPEDPHLYLGHPKYSTFVAALGPDDSSQSYMGLGAYGSTMEGPIPETNPTQYQYCVNRIPPSEVTAICQAMPPLYCNVIKVNPMPVADTELAELVTLAWRGL